MKSDVIKVTREGESRQAALNAAAASAAYRGVEKKGALHLQLLTEEMLGMMQQIVGRPEGEFWVESEGNNFQLHLVVRSVVTENMREELLKTSTSGKNEAAKGLMGKVRDIFNRALAAQDLRDWGDLSGYYEQGVVPPNELYAGDPMTYTAAASAVTWSLNRYKNAVEEECTRNSEEKEKWDELEKSIVANLADEVKIAIVGGKVEMTVYKNF